MALMANHPPREQTAGDLIKAALIHAKNLHALDGGSMDDCCPVKAIADRLEVAEKHEALWRDTAAKQEMLIQTLEGKIKAESAAWIQAEADLKESRGHALRFA